MVTELFAVFSQQNIAAILEKLTFADFLFLRLVLLFGLYIVGLVFIMLVRRPTAMTISCMLSEPAKNISIGILGVIVAPLIALFLAGTLIGIPIAVLLMMYWFAMLYIAQVFVAITIGFGVLHAIDPHHHYHSIMWTLVAGGVVWSLVTMIPYVGLVLQIIGMVWAFGALIQVQREILREFNEVPEEKP